MFSNLFGGMFGGGAGYKGSNLERLILGRNLDALIPRKRGGRARTDRECQLCILRQLFVAGELNPALLAACRGLNALAEQIREILVQEQDHQIDLATALGEEVPDVSRLRKRRG